MDSYWLRALEAAEAAEETARRLRQRYGSDAEAHLKDEAPRWRSATRPPPRLDDVRRALRWT